MQEIQLENARKNGIIAVVIMSASSCLSIIFLLFSDDLPRFITQNLGDIKQIFTLPMLIVSTCLYYKALKSISNLSSSSITKIYQNLFSHGYLCLHYMAL